jgi:DNA-binding Lrp family transcriptional regulator
MLEDLDKKILSYLSSGVYSYEDLAKTLKVTRGTVYRRIARLEKNKLIQKRVTAIPNYSNLHLNAVFLGVDANYSQTEEIAKTLAKLPAVKGLWRSYGAHQIVAELICERGCEGNAITDFHEALADSSARISHVAIGFDWIKLDLSPY